MIAHLAFPRRHPRVVDYGISQFQQSGVYNSLACFLSLFSIRVFVCAPQRLQRFFQFACAPLSVDRGAARAKTLGNVVCTIVQAVPSLKHFVFFAGFSKHSALGKGHMSHKKRLPIWRRSIELLPKATDRRDDRSRGRENHPGREWSNNLWRIGQLFFGQTAPYQSSLGLLHELRNVRKPFDLDLKFGELFGNRAPTSLMMNDSVRLASDSDGVLTRGASGKRSSHPLMS